MQQPRLIFTRRLTLTLILKQLFAFVKLLNSETGTNQIAAGLCCGLILGFTPALSLQSFLVFFLLFFFRIQIGAAFMAAFFFKLIAYMLDPVFDSVGALVLENQALLPLFTSLYNMPIVPFTRFNNTIVMGSGVVTLVLTLPMFFVFRYLIIKYRVAIVQRFQKTKFWKLVKATALYKWYVKYDSFYG